jgi:hypothetical protein
MIGENWTMVVTIIIAITQIVTTVLSALLGAYVQVRLAQPTPKPDDKNPTKCTQGWFLIIWSIVGILFDVCIIILMFYWNVLLTLSSILLIAISVGGIIINVVNIQIFFIFKRYNEVIQILTKHNEFIIQYDKLQTNNNELFSIISKVLLILLENNKPPTTLIDKIKKFLA